MLCLYNISKEYAPGIGLLYADFIANSGDILAIVGPNGAGKSTLLKIICDVHRQDKGECLLNGKPIFQCKNKIGYLPEIPYLIDNLNAYQFLKFIAGMKSITTYENIDRLIYYFNVEQYADYKLKNLSQGQRKKVALIASLIGDPYLLVLDEPTNGIDTMTLIKLKELLRKRSIKGKITIISSHVLDFVKNVATKVVFIKEGKAMLENINMQEIERIYLKIFS